MADIATSFAKPRKPAVQARPPAPQTASAAGEIVPLEAVAAPDWQDLADRAIEPNGYHLPDWVAAVNASARRRTGMSALTAWVDTAKTRNDAPRMIGLMPVISLWRAFGIPLPGFVSADPYGTLGTPLLDRHAAEEAARRLMRQARRAGARVLLIRDMALDGAAMKAFAAALATDGLRPVVQQSHARACLDATRDADELLREALGAKKLKELRRQRHRLAEHGAVVLEVATAPADVVPALETFLELEASGWKGKRGTALNQHDGDLTFIRRGVAALAARSQCQIVTLRAGSIPVAAAIVLRHGDRAFYFKLGIDARFAKFSPGVQFTLDLTRYLCADPSIALADSTATPGHSMIDPIWRGRLAIGDVLIPLRPHDPVIPFIRLAMALHRHGREGLRRALRSLRTRNWPGFKRA